MFEANQTNLFADAPKPAIKEKTTKEAFEQAIKDGRLSLDKSALNYVGHYMYMGPGKGGDSFKHVMTREYIK